MSKRNPKQEGSNLYDCRVQIGLCPNGCNQCFYNRLGAYYENIEKPHKPQIMPEGSFDKGHGIVRMNCGHDSNIEREKVIEAAKHYNNVFFNTSIPNFNFPGPVVFTANSNEEDPAALIDAQDIHNLMFIRLRVSATNLEFIRRAVEHFTTEPIPVVLTFMAYYNMEPPGCTPAYQEPDLFMWGTTPGYIWKKRHINSYWCPTPAFMRRTLKDIQKIGGRLVTMCGTPDSPWCRDCRNCETYYWQTKKYLDEIQ